MQIKNIVGGFEEIFDSAIVKKIVCTYDGVCKVYYRNGEEKHVNIECSSYNSQFGVPTSLDGRILFVSSWEKGLFAYDIDTGIKLWHFKSTRIRAIYVYETYLVTIRYGESILKISIADGSKICELRSTTVEFSYSLVESFILVNTFRGKLCVIDTEKMAVAKQYSCRDVNPTKAISFLIQSVSLKKNKLTISGLENSHPFTRVVDAEFLPRKNLS